MNKKPYIKPEMEIVNCESQTALLAGSGENPWWKEPDHLKKAAKVRGIVVVGGK